MKTEYKIILTTIGILAFCIFMGITTAKASDRSGPTNPTPTTYSTSSDDNGSTIQGIVISAAVVGIVLCVKSKCWKKKDPEPLPDPGPAVITPSNLSDRRNEGY